MITVTFVCDGDGCGAVAEAPTPLPALGLRRPDGWDLIYDPPTRDDTWPPYRTFCPVCWAKISGEPVETIRGTQ